MRGFTKHDFTCIEVVFCLFGFAVVVVVLLFVLGFVWVFFSLLSERQDSRKLQ